jgi:hypothetical protein
LALTARSRFYSKKRSALVTILGYRAVTEERCDFSSASLPSRNLNV